MEFKVPILQAHRGYHVKGVQENTLSAMNEAYKLGYEMAELDVRLSKDNVPVVFHDTDLKRLKGLKLRVRDLSAKELKNRGDIPSLKELLVSNERPAKLNIEIKAEHILIRNLVKKIWEDIKDTETLDQVLISSFNPFCLREMRKMNRDITLAFLQANKDHPFHFEVYSKLLTYPALRQRFFNLEHTLIDLKMVRILKTLNIGIAAWTVNDLSRAQELVSMGVDSIISDTILPHEIG